MNLKDTFNNLVLTISSVSIISGVSSQAIAENIKKVNGNVDAISRNGNTYVERKSGEYTGQEVEKQILKELGEQVYIVSLNDKMGAFSYNLYIEELIKSGVSLECKLLNGVKVYVMKESFSKTNLPGTEADKLSEADIKKVIQKEKNNMNKTQEYKNINAEFTYEDGKLTMTNLRYQEKK